MERVYVSVLVNSNLKSDRLFTYYYDKNKHKNIKKGSRIVVSFGKGSYIDALVWELGLKKPDFKCKEIEYSFSDEFGFSSYQIELIKELRINYGISLFSAFRSIIPSAQKLKKSTKYLICKNNILSLNKGDEISEARLLKLANRQDIQKMLKDDKIERKFEFSISVERRVEEYVKSNIKELNKVIESYPKRAVKKIRILSYAYGAKTCTRKKICDAANCTRLDLVSLARDGHIELFTENVSKESVDYFQREKTKDSKLHKLTVEQEIISEDFEKNFRIKPYRAIVNGVTGSGKTRLYIELAKKVLDKKGQVLFLVPEIALSPQLITRLNDALDCQIAVIHSKVSDKDKSGYYQDIKTGKISVVVGARSAMFAPFSNLALVIVDESHESSYISDSSPVFDSVDILIRLSLKISFHLILGSASTKLEHFLLAKKAKMKILELKKRVNKNPLPKIELIDMSNAKIVSENISRILYNEIKARFDKDEQVILLHNRRGYSIYQQCTVCKKVEKCINCDVSLSLRNKNADKYCRYCDFRKAPSSKCIYCGGELASRIPAVISYRDSFAALFKDKRIEALDSDNTSSSEEYIKTLDDFRQGKINMIIGTQVIAKGHDFPNVTLAAILNADQIFSAQDYLSAERSFSLMYQLAGRAGRAEKEGKVLIQCRDLEHRTLKYLLNNDFMGFLKHENEIRKSVDFPPYSRFYTINFVSEDEELAKSVSAFLWNSLSKFVFRQKLELEIYSPRARYFAKIQNKYKYYILIKNISVDHKKMVDFLYNIVILDKYKIHKKNLRITLGFEGLGIVRDWAL